MLNQVSLSCYIIINSNGGDFVNFLNEAISVFNDAGIVNAVNVR